MKKKLLIAYGNPYIFHGSLTPLTAKLSETFDIFILTTNYYINDDFTERLEHWKKEGTIIDYLVVPWFINNSTEIQNILKVHYFMRLKLNYLRKQKFDILLVGSTQEIYERYLIDCTLPHKCIRVGLQSCGFPIAKFPFIIEAILMGENVSSRIKNLVIPLGIIQNETSKSTIKDNFLRRISSNFKNSSKLHLMKKGILFLLNRFLTPIRTVMDRYIIPLFLVQKIFPQRKYEYLTCFDMDTINYVIVFQKIQALVFRSLNNNVPVYLAQDPLIGHCRCCLAQAEPDKLLLCLNGYEGTNNQQELLYRDLKIVLLECGAKDVHIKPHPRERGSQLERLQIYLQEMGITASVMEVDKPIRDIVCDYIGVVGCTSTSLLEARSACYYAFVVGFVAISQTYVENPKYLLGDIDNLEKRIDWIEGDGSYNPDIFKRRYHPAPPYPSIPEILTEIIGNSKK